MTEGQTRSQRGFAPENLDKNTTNIQNDTNKSIRHFFLPNMF